MNLLRNLADVVLRLFALGLLVTIVLNWMNPTRLATAQRSLNRFYDVFLNPIRRYVRPIKLTPSAPVGLDLTPLILLLAIWLLAHPFLMWALK